jgi:hypothetical protein
MTHFTHVFLISRAGDEARTRDLQLGRLSLYQLSYARVIHESIKITLFSQKYELKGILTP